MVYVQVKFECLQGWNFSPALWLLLQVLTSFTGKKHASLCLVRISFVLAWVLISCPITGHLQGEPSSVFSPPPHPEAADSGINPLCHHSHCTHTAVSLSWHSSSFSPNQLGGPTGLTPVCHLLPETEEPKLDPVPRGGEESLPWPYHGH